MAAISPPKPLESDFSKSFATKRTRGPERDDYLGWMKNFKNTKHINGVNMKRWILIAVIVMLKIGLGKWYAQSQKEHDALANEEPEVRVSANVKKKLEDPVGRQNAVPRHTTDKKISGIWKPDFAPLNEEEKNHVIFLKDQIESFNKLGYIPEENINEFRNYMFLYADRAVAEVTRKLDAVSRENVTDKEQAKELIKEIDMLEYLSDATHLLSKEAIIFLATRPIEWDEYGNLKDSAAANVTFEAFDLLAKNYPEIARNHMEKIPKENLQGYVMRYIYGRNLKGLDEEKIKSEISYIIASATNSSSQ